MAQSRWVGGQIQKAGGDQVRVDYVLLKDGEAESALRGSRVDVLVHRYCDPSLVEGEGLQLAATPTRDDPADVLIIRKDECDPSQSPPLKNGASVGCSSATVQAQLLECRGDLSVPIMEGSLHSRIEFLRGGKFSAVVVTAAGISRLKPDLSDFMVYRMDPNLFVPVAGQGALALQTRAGDKDSLRVLDLIHDSLGAYAIDAERGFVSISGATRDQPVGAWAEWTDDGLRLNTVVASNTWSPAAPTRLERVVLTYNDPEELAWEAFEAHKDRLSGDVVFHGAGESMTRVLLTGSEGVGRRQAEAFKEAGYGVVFAPMVITDDTTKISTIQRVTSALRPGDWIVFTTGASVRHLMNRLTVHTLPKSIRVAAVGPIAQSVANSYGLSVEPVRESSDHRALSSEFLNLFGENKKLRILVPMALQGDKDVSDVLKSMGHAVSSLPIYRQIAAPEATIEGALALDYDVALFSSAKEVEVYKEYHELPSICLGIGIGTLRSLRRAKTDNVIDCDTTDPERLVELVVNALKVWG